MAERIRAALAAQDIPVKEGEPPLRITASLGVSCFKPDDTTYEDALIRADLAMYRAKEQGRNQVVALPAG